MRWQWWYFCIGLVTGMVPNRRQTIIKINDDHALSRHYASTIPGGINYYLHDDVIKWKHSPCYWLFVRGVHRSPVNSPHKGQWRGALMFSFICAWINGWVNNCEAGDLRRHRAHYDLIVMWKPGMKIPHMNRSWKYEAEYMRKPHKNQYTKQTYILGTSTIKSGWYVSWNSIECS